MELKDVMFWVSDALRPYSSKYKILSEYVFCFNKWVFFVQFL